MWNCPIVISLSPARMGSMSPGLFPHSPIMSWRLFPLFLTLPLHCVSWLAGWSHVLLHYINSVKWTHGLIFGPKDMSFQVSFSHVHWSFPSHTATCIQKIRVIPSFLKAKGSIFQQIQLAVCPITNYTWGLAPQSSKEGWPPTVNLPHKQCSQHTQKRWGTNWTLPPSQFKNWVINTLQDMQPGSPWLGWEGGGK